jgi:hypothetical protein
VVIGSVALLVALASFWRAARPSPLAEKDSSWPRGVHLALISLMAASVFVGTALAWDTRWL